MCVEVNLRAGEVLRVSGPARIVVDDGEIVLVGAKYTRGASLVIHELRSYGLKALTDTKLSIVVGSGGSFERVSSEDEVIDVWLEMADHIAQSSIRPLKIIVIGPVESGKTTLSAFLSNYLNQKGLSTCLVEGDVGQEDLAIPATVALAKITKPFIWQRELSFNDIRFVGCISPQYCTAELLAGLVDLINENIGKCDVFVINTDGWVSSDGGLTHKLSIIRWIKPTHVLVLSESIHKFLKEVLGNYAKVMYVKPPCNVKLRDVVDRRNLRSEAYRRYFSNASVRTIKLGEVGFIKSRIFNTTKLSLNELNELFPNLSEIQNFIIYAGISENRVYILLDDKGLRDVQNLKIVSLGKLPEINVNVVLRSEVKGCLVGVLGEGFKDVGAGIIEDVFLEDGNVFLKIRTPYEGLITALVGSNIKLSEDFKEVGKPIRCGI